MCTVAANHDVSFALLSADHILEIGIFSSKYDWSLMGRIFVSNMALAGHIEAVATMSVYNETVYVY